MQLYKQTERVQVQPYDPSGVNILVNAGQKYIGEMQRRDLEQRNSVATIEMLGIETNIVNKLVDVEKQLDDTGHIDGINLPNIAEQIRMDEYEGFTPPPELKHKYVKKQAEYQAAQSIRMYASYGAIKEKKIKADFKRTYGDIAILATREAADENIEKITTLVSGMSISQTQYNTLLSSSIEGHNNQMYRNELNNPENNLEKIESYYKEFKNNRYGVGLENHKTIDRLFIGQIKSKKAGNRAFAKAQKRQQIDQTITRFNGCRNIDSASAGCNFTSFVNNPDYPREQQEEFEDFENIQKPLRPLLINMAAGYSTDIDKVMTKMQAIVADETVPILGKNGRNNAKKTLTYMDKQRSQFEAKIRQPDGIYFVIAQLNKGDNTDIMGGVEHLSKEWMAKANSIMARIGVPEQERMLLPRETREQLAVDPFNAITAVLDTAEQENWNDVSRRVAIKEINKITGLPKGMSILLTQDSTKGTRALKNYKSNKELYGKGDNTEIKITEHWFTDSTRKKLRLSGMPVESINKFDSAIEIQALSTWALTGGDMDNILKETSQEIINKEFTFGGDDINGGYLRFDRSKVTQDLADDYVNAVDYIINEPVILDKIILWDGILGPYDREEVYDLIADATIISTDNDTSFGILSGNFTIPFTEQMTYEKIKGIYDDYIKYKQLNTPKLNL